MSVSGTNMPPYGPKCPRASGTAAGPGLVAAGAGMRPYPCPAAQLWQDALLRLLSLPIARARFLMGRVPQTPRAPARSDAPDPQAPKKRIMKYKLLAAALL